MLRDRLLQLEGSVARAPGVARGGWRARLERTGAPAERRRRWARAVTLTGSYVVGTSAFTLHCRHAAALRPLTVPLHLSQLNQKPAHVTDRRYLESHADLHRDAPPRYFRNVLRFMQELHQFE